MAEVIVHATDGTPYSQLIVRRQVSPPVDDEFEDDEVKESLRLEAMRLMPGRDELRARIGKPPRTLVDYSSEDDEPPC